MLELIEKYAQTISDEEDPVLKELERETNLKVLMPRMLSGNLQGKLLEFLSKLIKPEKILELGTFTGYSTICLSKGLATYGKITTIEINDELEDIIRKFLNKANVSNKVNLIFGDALNEIPKLDDIFDLVFLDADKRLYLDYYNLFFDKVKKGGFIIADNVFWYGKVIQPIDKKDLYTQGIIKFNNFVKNDKRVSKFAIPIRDGLLVLQKK